MDNIISKSKKFPPLKQTSQLALAKLDDTESELKDVANILMTDGALSSAILKLANSPLYGISRKITTINEACVLLGRFSLKNLVLSMAVYGDMMKLDLGFIDRKGIWDHSLKTGCFAKHIAKRAKCSTDILLTSGILHKFGVIVLAWSDSERYKQVLKFNQEFEEPDYVGEKSILNHTHAEIGSQLLQSWNVPEDIVQCIGKYIEQYETPNDNAASVLALASKIASFDEPAKSLNDTNITALMQFLGIEESEIEALLNMANNDYNQLKLSF